MDYLSVDFTTFPLRGMRSTIAANKLLVKECAEGPQSEREEQEWLKDWLRSQKRWFKATTLLAIWDSPAVDASVQLATLPSALEQPQDQGSSLEKSETQEMPAELEESGDITHRCSLTAPFELKVRVNREESLRVFEELKHLHGSCHKLSILPMTLWAALLMSYADALEKTVAIVWRSRDAWMLMVVERGQLVFHRQFLLVALEADAWTIRMKECLERFSFSFPAAKIDWVLLGGDLKNHDKFGKWIQELLACPYELVSPVHSGQVEFFKKRSSDREPQSLSEYWSCMGIVWGQVLAWK